MLFRAANELHFEIRKSLEKEGKVPGESALYGVGSFQADVVKSNDRDIGWSRVEFESYSKPSFNGILIGISSYSKLQKITFYRTYGFYLVSLSKLGDRIKK